GRGSSRGPPPPPFGWGDRYGGPPPQQQRGYEQDGRSRGGYAPREEYGGRGGYDGGGRPGEYGDRGGGGGYGREPARGYERGREPERGRPARSPHGKSVAPSVLMALTHDGLTRLLEPEGWRAAPQPLVMQLARLRRFIVDETLYLTTGPMMPRACDDAFELTLSDGSWMKRCVLSTILNELVYRGDLRALQLVRVDCFHHYADELTGDERVVVTALTPLAPLGGGPPPAELFVDEGGQFVRASAAGGHAPSLVAEQVGDARPVAGVRRYFVRLESNRVDLREPPAAGAAGGSDDEVEAEAAEADDPEDLDDEGEPVEVLTLAAMRTPSLAEALKWHKNRKPGARLKKGEQPPALLGRIVRLSAPAHFGRADDASSQKQINAVRFFWLCIIFLE
ncbi:hypothetical protein T492DRAFT_850979, partial [Pavlovales sp. CCMP2436]